MARGSQKALAQLAIFGTVLCLVLLFNHPHSSSKTFAWTTIRYKSSSLEQHVSRGVCPGLKDITKPVLVVSGVDADGSPDWLDDLSDRYHLCLYDVDARAETESNLLRVPANRGHEAMAYLTFIIDNYDDIPADGAVFVHGSRFAWHNDHSDYDNRALLSALNVSSALASVGYHNMRCDWSASTCVPPMKPQGSFETSMHATTEPWDARAVSDSLMPRALAVLFGGDGSTLLDHQQVFLGRADTLRSQCCAQFVVSRDNVWRHARHEYVALRQWLLGGSQRGNAQKQFETINAAPLDDRVAGRMLSYMWHILFLSGSATTDGGDGIDLQQLNRLACPSAEECYCRLYGRCDLTCTSPDRCQGLYHVPPQYRLPDDWANTHP